MKAYMNGHTIHRHMHHGQRWYTVDDDTGHFASTCEAAQWIRQHFGNLRMS